MADKKSFVMYNEWAPAFSKMTNEQAGELIKAIFQYQSEGDEIALSPELSLLFEIIKGKFDADTAKYQEECRKNKENGLKGGRPKTEKTQENPKNPVGFEKTEKTQPNPKNPDNDNDNDNDFDNDGDNDIDKGKDKGVQGEKGKIPPAAAAAPVPFVNYEEIVEDYNTTCKSLSKVTTLSDNRRKAIRARLNKYSREDIHKAFTLAEESDFLKGGNNRNWTANFDWIMKDANIAKILDGNYTNRPRDSGPPGQEDGFEWLTRQLQEGGFK